MTKIAPLLPSAGGATCPLWDACNDDASVVLSALSQTGFVHADIYRGGWTSTWAKRTAATRASPWHHLCHAEPSKWYCPDLGIWNVGHASIPGDCGCWSVHRESHSHADLQGSTAKTLYYTSPMRATQVQTPEMDTFHANRPNLST